MFARLLLLPLLWLSPPDEGSLARSGLSERELTRMCQDVQEFFAALEQDDRSAQQESLDELEEAMQKASRRKIEGSLLEYLGDWDLILEEAKPEDRSIRSRAGRGFERIVFSDAWDPEGRRIVSMLSLPSDYTRSDELLPAIVALKDTMGLSGDDLEEALSERGDDLYGDLLETHIVLVPVGLEEGEGREAETTGTDGSWYTDANRYVFFTGFRVLLEKIRFDRARVVLDGWGEAGLDALRLASASPSFFAGVIDRSGGFRDPQAILGNLKTVPLLYVHGAEDGGPDDVSELPGLAPGVDVTVLEEGGSSLAPSDETRGAIAEWVRARRRDLAPQELEFKVRDLLAASLAWCTAAEINRRVTAEPSDEDFPRFHAKIDPASNTIRIETVNVLELWLHLSDALVDMDEPVTITVNGEERVHRTFRRSLRNLLEGRFYNNSGDYGLYTNKVLIEDIDPNVPKKDS